MRAHGAFPVLLLAVLAVAGCLGQAPAPSLPQPTSAPVAPPAAVQPVPLKDCRGSLHVWLVPLGDLAKVVPPEFPPQEYMEEGVVPTGMGRLGFYFINCGEGEAGSLKTAHHEGPPPAIGLLAVRVVPKDQSLVAGNATPLYALQVYARGEALEGALNVTGMPLAKGDAQDGLSALPAVELPSYDMSLKADDGTIQSHIQGTQPEEYNRLFRSFYMRDNATSVMDLNMTSTLWEGTGTISYSDTSAIAKFLPTPFQANTDYHILVKINGDIRVVPPVASEAHHHMSDGIAPSRTRAAMPSGNSRHASPD